MNKLLSIVIPTRNRKSMVSVCLESVEKYLEFSEVIIVSNGESIKNDIPVEYLKSDKFKKVRSDKRLTMSQNWHYGFQFVNTKWVMYLADDDFLVIEPSKLNNYLVSTETDALLFKHKSFNWNQPLSYKQDFVQNNKHNLESTDLNTLVDLKNKKHRFWYMENVNRIPSGSATSIIKCSFLRQLDKSGFLFSGISPDWNVAAHFLYSDVSYTKFSETLIFIGESEISSVSLARDPTNAKFKLELELLPEKYLHSRIKNFPIACPTTWISRIDSILHAREHVGFPTKISDDLLLISSLDTTPRYVKKMLMYMEPNVKTKIPIFIIFSFMYCFSLVKFIKRKMQVLLKNSKI